MTGKSSYSAFFCPTRKNPKQERIFISFGGKYAKVFAASSKTYAFIDKFGKCFGFGSNQYKQITDKLGVNVSMPLPLSFCQETAYELSCGETFIAVISKTNKVYVNGKNYNNIKIDNLQCPRGISAFGENFAFAYETNKIAVFTGSSDYSTFEVDKNDQVIKTVLTNSKLAVLCSNGNIYSGSIGKDLNYIGKAHRLFGSSDSIILCQEKMKIEVIKDNGTKFELYTPTAFDVAMAGTESGDIFIIDTSGKLAHTTEKERKFSLHPSNFNNILSMPLYGSISAFSLIGERPIFVVGVPEAPVSSFKELPLVANCRIKLPEGEDVFFATSDKIAFFKNSRVPISVLMPIISSFGSIGNVFFTSISRAITLDRSNDTMFSVNLLAGDNVVVNGKPAVVAGTAQGSLWIIPEGTTKVYVACDMTLTDVMQKVQIVSRENHTLLEVCIDGIQTYVDTTESFIEEFNYSLGDLLWIPGRGTCELLGVYANSLALLDLETRCVFAQEPYALKVLRRSSKKLRHTRDVMRVDGKRVSIDISCDGNRFFVPTDRVMSPLGIATVLGFAETAYIQTDEMRMNGYEAVPMDILRLQLVRRISLPAQRRIETSDGKIISVSLDTERSVDGILPGDILLIGSTYARAIGVCEEGWYALFKGEKKAKLLPPSMAVTVIYRADINATRSWTVPLHVGSPLMGESIFLPGDIVNLKGFGKAEFVGFTDTEMKFVSRESGEVLSLTFSTCLLPDLFEVESRPALLLSTPEK